MNQKRKENLVAAFAISGILAIILIVVLTILAELYSPLKSWLKEIFFHHWVGKGVLSFVGFFVVGLIIARTKIWRRSATALLYLLAWVSLLGAALIIAFYIYEAFFIAH